MTQRDSERTPTEPPPAEPDPAEPPLAGTERDTPADAPADAAADAPADAVDVAEAPAVAAAEGLAAPAARAAPEFAWTPELAAGRAPGSSGPPPPQRGRRWLDGLVWIVGVLLALGISTSVVRTADGLGPAMDPRSTGRVFGTLLGAFIVAFVLWALVVWLSRRRGTERRLASPIVPLLAIVLLLIRLGGAGATPAETALAPSPSLPAAVATATASPAIMPGPTASPSAGATAGPSGAASPRPSVDPAVRTALLRTLVIDQPYLLQVPPADEEREFLSFFSGEDFGVVRDIAVRRVLDGGIVGFVIVADMAVDPAFEAVTLAGIEIGVRGEGGTATRETIDGRTVLIGESGGAAFVMWVEAPSMKIVYGYDIASARSIARAFVVPK